MEWLVCTAIHGSRFSDGLPTETETTVFAAKLNRKQPEIKNPEL